MPRKTKDKAWRTPTGEPVPESAISPYDKRKEKVVTKMFTAASKVSEMLLGLKHMLADDCEKLYAERLRIKGVEEDGKRKGNFTFYSYDKSIKIEIQVNNLVVFNDDINLAQMKLEQYVTELTQDSKSTDIRALINSAFTTRKGSLDKARVMALFSLDIKHPLWKEAMELIKGSIEVTATKRYASISVRNEAGEYEQIPLSFSAV